MKRILIIAYSYPPLMEAQSLRWAHLSRELRMKGHAVDVLTISLPDYYRDGFYLIEKIPVFRSYPGPIQGLFFRAKASLQVEDRSYQEKRKSTFHQFLRKEYEVLRRVLNQVMIPDFRTEWFVFAIPRLFCLMREKRYDLLITSHEPGVDHLLGAVVKRIYPVYWVGDFSDPMVAPYTPKWRKSFDQKVQGSLLRKMDLILVTNEKLKKDFRSHYPFLSQDQICVLPQGFDGHLLLKDTKEEGPYGKKLRLIYTGTFYRNERDPAELLKALRELEIEIEFVIAGRNDAFVEDLKRFGLLESKVTYLGYLSYKDSLAIQADGNVLVYLGNRVQNQVPGKIYEYLGSKKPILAIVQHPCDEAEDLVSKLRRGVVTVNQASKIKEAILDLWGLYKEKRLYQSFNLSLEGIEQYSWQALAERLLSQLPR